MGRSDFILEFGILGWFRGGGGDEKIIFLPVLDIVFLLLDEGGQESQGHFLFLLLLGCFLLVLQVADLDGVGLV